MGWFSLPAADDKVRGWHVAPGIDVVAYALSWVWVLIPLALMGPTRPDYVGLYVLILAATDVHRHFNFPYVYADREIRSQYPLRFFLFPGLLLALFVASPWLASQRLYLNTAQVGAGVAWVVVLFQVLRRDGSDDAADGRALVTVALPMLIAAVAVTAVSPASGLQRLGNATWWFAGALLTATYLDFDLRRRRATKAVSPSGHPKVPVGPVAKARRLFVAPALVLTILALSTVLGPGIDGAQRHGGFLIRHVLNVVAVVAFGWNVWHVYAQKYGILRLYNAKADKAEGPGVPGWVDRLVIFAWVPLYVAWLGPLHEQTLRLYFPKARQMLPSTIDALRSVAWITLPIAISFLVTALVLWIVHERRVYGMRSAPRLWMAGGTEGLGLAFLLVDPVKAYLAFSFSHAVEYMVFVWAFQRRRYAQPLPHRPALQRILSRPWLAYLGFIFALGVAFVYLKYYGRFVFADEARPEFLGWRTAYWIGFWGIYQSMVHFYWDGFLWKMRRPNVRETV